MFKCQKVQITADAESALRPSSVRVVTRKRKDRKKKKARKRKWDEKQGRESTEWKQRDMSRWGTKKKKKKKSASLLDVLFFPWWSSFSGSEVKWGRGRRVMLGLGCWGWRVIVVVCARFFFFLCVSGQLSAAVGWRLSLSMHGGALVLDFVQVLLLRDRQHRRQDLVVLPVCQAWNTNTQNIWELLIHRPALLTSTSAVQIKLSHSETNLTSFASFRKPAEGQYFFVCDSTHSSLKHFGVLLARKV